MSNKATDRQCMVCRESVSKYRCPSCNYRYCSLSCFKKHKEKICVAESSRLKKCEEERNKMAQVKEEDLEEGEVYDDVQVTEDEDRLNEHDLAKLANSKAIRDLLCNPHLRKMITEIDCHPNPGVILGNAMREPVFAEFADQCLAVVQDPMVRKASNENDAAFL
ncbi:predicted protein [Nematostella vectensis]|uniref:Zinc finger HIT domain-containing protein 3 n=1 Tax=Nematostella vectensis TaxID=45351 RepID=A7STA1_NEMVE|nr:zinc finger HIT domain-containing protein 3 [Nematostella vectensis]EDO33062.1 predicted protein [Nematostella vectensis]|eukprot:XP_001625162.1 predicted protein [Nematostella vectensis]